jgi:lipopolysaccharide cholinephosphotransferase
MPAPDTNSTLQQLQAMEMEVLDAIDELCRKHGISWWLDSGTALGARRHGGFIPWDDDIDIGMLREDYDRFCQVAPDGLRPGFSFHNARRDEGFAPMFSKVWKDGTKFHTQETIDAGLDQGVFVDVFPYDYIDEAHAAQVRKALNKAQRLSYLYHSRHINVPGKGFVGTMQKAGCAIAHVLVRAFVKPERIARSFDEARLACPPCDWVITSACATEDPLPLDVIVPTRNLVFEGRSYPCPGQIERYLESFYGNWQELPPEGERRTHMPLLLEF